MEPSKRAFELMRKLGYTRVSGSPEELRTAEALKAEVEAIGLPCTIEDFEVAGGEVSEARLIVLAPYEKEYPVTGYIRSDSTPDEGIELDFRYVEDCAPVLMQGAEGMAIMCNQRVTMKSYEKLQEAKPAAIITFNGDMRDSRDIRDINICKLREPLSDKFGYNVLINMDVWDAAEMVEMGAERVKLIVKSERKNVISHNVCTEIRGTDLPDEIISFGAHYDSVYFSKGVYDNMSGSVINMEVLRYFAENPPKRTLKFNWFGSEEQGLLGSKAYTKAHEEELKNHRLMINVDVAGPILGSDGCATMGADGFVSYVEGLMNEMGLAVNVEDHIYSSDSVPFADNGVPAVNFVRSGANGTAYIHNRHDNLELGYMSEKALNKTLHIVLEFSKRMANSVVLPVERKISDSMREAVDKYLFRK